MLTFNFFFLPPLHTLHARRRARTGRRSAVYVVTARRRQRARDAVAAARRGGRAARTGVGPALRVAGHLLGGQPLDSELGWVGMQAAGCSGSARRDRARYASAPCGGCPDPLEVDGRTVGTLYVPTDADPIWGRGTVSSRRSKRCSPSRTTAAVWRRRHSKPRLCGAATSSRRRCCRAVSHDFRTPLATMHGRGRRLSSEATSSVATTIAPGAARDDPPRAARLRRLVDEPARPLAAAGGRVRPASGAVGARRPRSGRRSARSAEPRRVDVAGRRAPCRARRRDPDPARAREPARERAQVLAGLRSRCTYASRHQAGGDRADRRPGPGLDRASSSASSSRSTQGRRPALGRRAGTCDRARVRGSERRPRLGRVEARRRARPSHSLSRVVEVPSGAPCMSQRILVVDDEPQFLRALGTNLRGAGYDVETADTAAEALVAAAAASAGRRDPRPRAAGRQRHRRLPRAAHVDETHRSIVAVGGRRGGGEDRGARRGRGRLRHQAVRVDELLARLRAVLRRSGREASR